MGMSSFRIRTIGQSPGAFGQEKVEQQVFMVHANTLINVTILDMIISFAESLNSTRVRVVVQFGDLNSNPKRERGPNALPRLRFALTMGFPENYDFSKLYHDPCANRSRGLL